MNDTYLFFDMDGTLISPKSHHILPSSIRAINAARKNGCRTFLCTGRGYALAMEYQDEVELDGVIFSNGAGIAYQGKILETKDIRKELVHQMIELIDSLGGGYQILCVNACYQNKKEHLRFASRFPTEYPDLSLEQVFQRKSMLMIDEYQGEPVQKIDFNFDSELIADLFFARIPASLEVVMSGGYYAHLGRRGGELMVEGTTKGIAVERVLDMFGGNKHDAYGFGDSMNDLQMIRTCGVGIAMGNGSEDIKKSADYTTDDADHDGIENALKHFHII